MPDVISNTSPVQYLYQTGFLDLLRALYGQIVVPTAVADEVERGIALGVALPHIAELPWVQVRSPRSSPILPLVRDMGIGERETLALALENPGSLVLLDDSWARQNADVLGISFTGTLGVLLKAKEAGYIPAIAPVLDHLDALGFYLGRSTRAAVLRIARETGSMT